LESIVPGKDGENVEPRFPVFLKDRDGWMYLIKLERDFARIEKIDVEGNEYSGWDFDGKRIGLKIKDGRILCFIKEGSVFFDELKAAIVMFANKAGPKSWSFRPEKTDDILDLFDGAERHAQRSQLLHKVASFFRKLLSRR
jgi:hypothetical protein